MQVKVFIHTAAETTVQFVIDITVTAEVMRSHEITTKQVRAQVSPELEHVLLRSIDVSDRLYKLRLKGQIVRIYFILIRVQIFKIIGTARHHTASSQCKS